MDNFKILVQNTFQHTFLQHMSPHLIFLRLKLILCYESSHVSVLPLKHISVHSCIQTISIAPLQVRYYSEALPTQHGYWAGVSRRSATGNCELRTCPLQGPNVAARAGFEPTTLQSKGFDSTNAPPSSTSSLSYLYIIIN